MSHATAGASVMASKNSEQSLANKKNGALVENHPKPRFSPLATVPIINSKSAWFDSEEV